MNESDDSRFEFSHDWFTRWIPAWRAHVPLCTRYVEVGCHDGRSFTWALENLCVDDDATAIAIDTWRWPEVERRFDANVVATGSSYKVRKLKGASRRRLVELPDGSADVVYVDGSHEARDVVLDGCLAYHVLRTGGVLVFDDYRWRNPEGKRFLPPKPAVDAFLSMHADVVDVLYEGYQVMVRRTA